MNGERGANGRLHCDREMKRRREGGREEERRCSYKLAPRANDWSRKQLNPCTSIRFLLVLAINVGVTLPSFAPHKALEVYPALHAVGVKATVSLQAQLSGPEFKRDCCHHSRILAPRISNSVNPRRKGPACKSGTTNLELTKFLQIAT